MKNKKGRKISYNYKRTSSKHISFILFVLQLFIGMALFMWMAGLLAKDVVLTPVIKEVQAKEITSNFNPCDLNNVECVTGVEYVEYSGTIPEQIAETAYYECNLHGLGQRCINDLLAIAWKETRYRCGDKGDGGNSHGCYQIYRIANQNVTVEQAENIVFSTRWTLNRMIRFGYPKYRTYAIRKHNGSANNPVTLRYFQSIDKYSKNLDK